MRNSRLYVQIDPDVLERARQIDLLFYLRAYEPSNLVKVKGTTNVYCTAEYDSLKVLLLPPKNKNCDRVIEYLFGRGIDYQIIQECVAEGIIFESANYHNAVFIGKNESGMSKYAACRGTMGSFNRDASGSDKRYSFRLLAREPCTSVHLFEAAIDLLSYATYLKCE